MREELLKNNTIRKSHKNNLDLIYNCFRKSKRKTVSKNDLKKEIFRVRQINLVNFGKKTLYKLDWRIKRLNLEDLNKKNLKKKEVLIKDFSLKEFGLKFFKKFNEKLSKLEVKHARSKELNKNILQAQKIIFLQRLNKLKKKFFYDTVSKKSNKIVRDFFFLERYFLWFFKTNLVFRNFKLGYYYKFFLSIKLKPFLVYKNNLIIRILKKKLYYYLILIINGRVATIISIGVLLKFFKIEEKCKKKNPKAFNLLMKSISKLYNKFQNLTLNKIFVIDFVDKNIIFFLNYIKQIVFKNKFFFLNLGLNYSIHRSKKYKSIKKRQIKENVEIYLRDLRKINKETFVKKLKNNTKYLEENSLRRGLKKV